ncbi:MAG TPA: hypothetical protein VKQ32_19940 [Polyangia bacterium]|nr:hypothetical protein [Polyangia bacterium]
MRSRFASPRHACRGLARAGVGLIAGTALLVSCTTTHFLARSDEPDTRAQLSALAAEGDGHVHLLAYTVSGRAPTSFSVSGVDPSGFVVEQAPGQSLVVPLSQVASVSRTNRRRGAWEGAIAGGILGFVAPLMLRVFIPSAFQTGCADDCGGQPSATSTALRVGVVGGLLGAVLGAAFGANAGHEDRFVVAP